MLGSRVSSWLTKAAHHCPQPQPLLLETARRTWHAGTRIIMWIQAGHEAVVCLCLRLIEHAWEHTANRGGTDLSRVSLRLRICPLYRAPYTAADELAQEARPCRTLWARMLLLPSSAPSSASWGLGWTVPGLFSHLALCLQPLANNTQPRNSPYSLSYPG